MTTWNLKQFYSSPKDPKIERDVQAIEKLYADFEKKYKNNKKYLTDEKELLRALNDWDKLIGAACSWRPIMYLQYCKSLDSSDPVVESLDNKLTQRLTQSANKIIFFNLNLSKIDEAAQKKFLKSGMLKEFHYYLDTQFKEGKHTLSEAEEKILNLKSLPAQQMWVDGQEKLLAKQTVSYGGKNIPIPEAMGMLSELPTSKRRKLYNDVMLVLKGISHFAESELNAVYTDKKIEDELRGHAEPYSGTILRYQNDTKTVLGLIDTVTRNFKISHKFYKLKAKMMKLPHLECVDKSASIGKTIKKIPFDQATQITHKAFQKLDPKYADMFQRFLKNGQIDAFPKKGKRGGAFCSGSIGNPTMVFLNHTDNINSVMTLGHEMGHAFHFEASKAQRPIYQDFTISVAEVVSTLFENFVFEELLQDMTEKEKVIALHDKIIGSISTVFRQIAAFNWELELHRTVREKGAISKEEIAKLHNKHMSSYLGPAFKMKEDDGYTFVQWPHLRYNFYVYSYAYGELISMALYRKYKRDTSFLKQIEDFLVAGSSKSPEQIFRDIGIDTSDPNFWIEGLTQIEDDIKQLEKLTK